jgi:hypothetical protein
MKNGKINEVDRDFSETARYAELGAIVKLEDGVIGEIFYEYGGFEDARRSWHFVPEHGEPHHIDENDILGTFYSKSQGWIGMEGNMQRMRMLVRNLEKWKKIADGGGAEWASKKVKEFEKLIKEVEEKVEALTL